ncbi:MAG: hypothetical protein ABW024_02705 [Microbacterium sp.]
MTSVTRSPRLAEPEGPVEGRIIRSSTPAWAAVAGWGAGLIELALGAGALTGGDVDRGAGVALLALGLGGLAWGAATLTRGRIVVPRVGVVGALLGIVATVAVFMIDPVRTSIAAVGAGVLLLVAIALACARQLRSRADAAPPRIAVLLVAAVVVAGVVTPALGATEAGRLAPDHGTHGIIDPGHHG